MSSMSRQKLVEAWIKKIPRKDKSVVRKIEVVSRRLTSLSGAPAQAIAKRTEKIIQVSLAGYENVAEWLSPEVAHEIGHFLYMSLPVNFQSKWERVTEEEGSVYEDITGGRIASFIRFRAEENFADWYRFKLHPSISASMFNLKGVYPKTYKLFKKFWTNRYGKW